MNRRWQVVFGCWIGMGVCFGGGVVHAATPTQSAIDCARAQNVVVKAICTDSTLRKLDAHLAAVYAKDLQKHPVQAKKLRRDERDWLGERDDAVWLALSNSGSAESALMAMYRVRITFLRNLDDPAKVRGLPILKAVLHTAPLLQSGMSSAFRALRESGMVVLGLKRAPMGAPRSNVIKLLPAPPAPHLRNQLLDIPTSTALVYLPSVKLGGVSWDEGSANCKNWVLFTLKDGRTHYVQSPASLKMGNCGKPPATHLALMDGKPVALGWEFIGPGHQSTVLQWQRWLGSKWSHPVAVRIRFARVLDLDGASCAPSVNCRLFRKAAMDDARRFDRRPLPATVRKNVSLTPRQHHEFTQMVAVADKARRRYESLLHRNIGAGRELDKLWVAKNQSVTGEVPNFHRWSSRFKFGTDKFDDASVYFPAKIGGHLVLGEIGHGLLGTSAYEYHVVGSKWLVGFWCWKNGKLVPLAGFVIDRDNGREVSASRMQVGSS